MRTHDRVLAAVRRHFRRRARSARPSSEEAGRSAVLEGGVTRCRFSNKLMITVVTVLLAAGSTLYGAEYSPAIGQALRQAGTNRPQIEAAISRVQADRREGLEFLIVNMPERDLVSLTAPFLLENTDGAYEAMEKVPWGKRVPQDIFLNDVLPYACVNERRDNWRRDFMTRFLPLVSDCKTPAAAAVRLNREIFHLLGVRYSTNRGKPDQSPYESIESKMASCTGLSILLVAACRSVGVPARFAGIPSWPDNSGNHSWVEVWDNGWHFTGAAEPAGDKLDRAWFVNQAKTAVRDDPRHSICATSFLRTSLRFPLAWAPGVDSVSATNVTIRYAQPAIDSGGKSAGKESSPDQSLAVQLKEFFNADPMTRKSFRFDPSLDRLLAEKPAAVRKAAWLAYREGWDRGRFAADFATNRVTHGKLSSAYTIRAVGKMPEGGWPLVIAMHGGGGAPKEVNDAGWRTMMKYYKDQPDLGGYLYLAIRAPNDDWNGFYADYNPPLTDNLLRQLNLFLPLNADRTYLIGYSHGGYGAYYQGTRMPDRFAAVHASAAAPTEYGEMYLNLRNTPFSLMVGEHDTAYERLLRCRWLSGQLLKLKAVETNAYPVKVEIMPGYTHGGLPDRDKIRDLLPSIRQPAPRRITWVVTPPVSSLNWLHVPDPKGGRVDAECRDNRVTIKTEAGDVLHVFLDERLVDFSQAVVFDVNGKTSERTVKPSLQALCESLALRGDPAFMWTSRTVLATGKDASR